MAEGGTELSVDTGVSVVDVLASRSPLNPLVPRLRIPRQSAPVTGPASLRALAPENAPSGTATRTARPQLRRDSASAAGPGQRGTTQGGSGSAALTPPGGLRPRRPTEAAGRGGKRPSAAQRRRHVISASQLAASAPGAEAGGATGPDASAGSGDREKGTATGAGQAGAGGEGALPQLGSVVEEEGEETAKGAGAESPSHSDEDKHELTVLAQRTRARRRALASLRQRMDAQDPAPPPRNPAPAANERSRVLANALGSERVAPAVRGSRRLAPLQWLYRGVCDALTHTRTHAHTKRLLMNHQPSLWSVAGCMPVVRS